MIQNITVNMLQISSQMNVMVAIISLRNAWLGTMIARPAVLPRAQVQDKTAVNKEKRLDIWIIKFSMVLPFVVAVVHFCLCVGQIRAYDSARSQLHVINN